MTTDTEPQTVLFPDLFDKPLFAKFNQEQASSDGGAVLLKAGERVYGLVKAFARRLSDKRAPEKIRHTLADLIGQRIFGIACGHPDCNDAEHLADDPIHKLLLGRDPVAGESLASQPTLSRFENAAGRGALYDMGCELAARVVERHRRRLGRVRRITIDLDPTDDPTHGAQQYSLFNGYYDNWCYLPLLAFLTFDREPEQYLCSAVLRHGKAVASEGGVALLARLLPLLRCAFPRARFLVRLDGGFASPTLFDFLGAQPRLDYVVAMASNAVLLRHAEPAMLVARARSEQTEHLYMDTDYAAGTWSDARRVIIKAEVVRLGDREPRDNPRFVVTNMRQTPHFLYEKVYCARGDVENRIKELKDLQLDRTSCCRLRANQLRVFLTAAAYVLMQELRLHAARTACPNPGDVAARPAAQAQRPRRQLRPPPRPASAALDAESRRVAQDRPLPRGARRVTRPTRVRTRVHCSASITLAARVASFEDVTRLPQNDRTDGLPAGSGELPDVEIILSPCRPGTGGRVRGAAVTAVSPAERGRSAATRLDGGEHRRRLSLSDRSVVGHSPGGRDRPPWVASL